MMAYQVLPTVLGSSYSIYGIFSAAGGVAPNQEVTYRGVQVGRVGKMTLTEDAVRIEMVIESGFKIPSEGVRARVLFKSAVGEQFIDLTPEGDGRPYLREGDVIAADRTSIPVQIEQLLRELNGVLQSIDPQALGSLIHEAGQGLTGHGMDLRDAILALDVLTRIGAQRGDDIANLIRSGADIQDSFNSTREDFVHATGSLRTVLEVLDQRRAELARTLAATHDLDTEITALLDGRRAQLNRILADLGTVVRISHAHMPDLDKLLTYLSPFLNDAVSAFDSPYYVFNLNTNLENPPCAYDPSSRPVRPVTDDSPKQPATDFACAAATATGAGSVEPLSPAMRAEFDRISWLRLFTLGY
jgi:phospholipid/cholesterol/gamma-HCH transport system substrate-binding protein